MYYMRLETVEYSAVLTFKPTFTMIKMMIFLPIFSDLNWEFSSKNWEKKILFGIGNITQ